MFQNFRTSTILILSLVTENFSTSISGRERIILTKVCDKATQTHNPSLAIYRSDHKSHLLLITLCRLALSVFAYICY